MAQDGPEPASRRSSLTPSAELEKILLRTLNLTLRFPAWCVVCASGTVRGHGSPRRAYRDVFTACPGRATHTPCPHQSPTPNAQRKKNQPNFSFETLTPLFSA